jgi:uncharacterized delta-60 repeat protein
MRIIRPPEAMRQVSACSREKGDGRQMKRITRTAVWAGFLVYVVGCSNLKPINRGHGGGAGSDGVAGETSKGGRGGSSTSGSGGVAGGAVTAGGASAAGGSGVLTGGSGGAGGATGATTLPVAKLSVTTGKPTVRVVAILGATLDVSVAREGTVTGDVKISVEGLPSGVVVPSVLVPATASSAKLTFTATSAAPIGGPYKISVSASTSDANVQSVPSSVNLYVAQSPGSFDASFGDKGVVRIKEVQPGSSTSTPREGAWGVAVDDVSRIYVGGSSSSTDGSLRRAWVLRLVGRGILDEGFADEGVHRDFGNTPTGVHAMLVANGNLFVSASYTDTVTSWSNYYLRRYSEAGAIDSGFNGGQGFPLKEQPRTLVRFGNGILSLAYLNLQLLTFDGEINGSFTQPTSTGEIVNVAADPQNRIIYSSRPLGLDQGFSVGRLLSNGTVDTSFGAVGLARAPCPDDPMRSVPGTLWSLGVTAESGVLALTNCGADLRGSYEWEGAIHKFTSAGMPDTAFGEGGKLLLASPGSGRDMVLQEDGRILVVVVDHVPDPDLWMLRRIEANSTTDFSFGQNGNVVISNAAASAFGYGGIALDVAAQRVVVVGNDGSAGFLVMRIWL